MGIRKDCQSYKTRAGSPVRIYATDGGGEHSIHGAWWNDVENVWIPCTWDIDGYFMTRGCPRSIDIVQEQIREDGSPRAA